jgi:hypothetical protein
VRRLVEDDRPPFAGEGGDPLRPPGTGPRQEALEDEPARRQPRRHECGDRRRRARDHDHVEAAVCRSAHHALARVGDARHAGVGHDGHGLASAQPVEDARHLRRLVVVVRRQQLLRPHARGLEQPTGAPRVLAHDDVGLGKGAHGARRQVVEVPDRRADEDERHGYRTSSVSPTLRPHRSNAPASASITTRAFIRGAPTRQRCIVHVSSTSRSREQ